MDELNAAINPPENLEAQDDTENSARFKNEASAGMKKICDLIGKLESLADKKNVTYTEEQIDSMFAYLSDRLERCKSRYKQKLEDQKGFDFTF